MTKVSKNSQQNNSETAANDHNKEITKERFISLEELVKLDWNYRWIETKIV